MITRNEDKHLVSIPGIYYGGGCAYMACSGVMMGPLKDALVLTHGPTGCRYFSGINGKRDQGSGETLEYRARTFSTNLEETDIVFGGEEKLRAALVEAIELFDPACIVICATCPVGLIGDDMHRIASDVSVQRGIPILPVSCEGFRNEGGWLTGAREIMDNWVGTDSKPCGAFPVHMMGEAFNRNSPVEGILRNLGYDVVCSMMGEVTYAELCRAQDARLIVLDSNKEIDEIPAEMARRSGAGFMRAQFTGIANMDAALRLMASFFGDQDLVERTERHIACEHERIAERLEQARASFSGMKVAVYEDIFRSDAFATLSDELGIEVAIVRQNYYVTEVVDDGFEVEVPASQVHLLERAMGQRPCPPAFEEERDRVKLTMDRCDVTAFLRLFEPDLVFAGIEEQFGYGEECPVRSELFTSDDRGVGYFGYDGIFRYAADLEMARRMSHWATDVPAWAQLG